MFNSACFFQWSPGTFHCPSNHCFCLSPWLPIHTRWLLCLRATMCCPPQWPLCSLVSIIAWRDCVATCCRNAKLWQCSWGADHCCHATVSGHCYQDKWWLGWPVWWWTESTWAWHHLWPLPLSNRSVSLSFFICLLTIIFIGQGAGFASKSWWPTDSNWQKNIWHTRWTEKADHFFMTRLEKLQAGTAEPLNFEQWRQHIRASSSIRHINGFIRSAWKDFIKAHLST